MKNKAAGFRMGLLVAMVMLQLDALRKIYHSIKLQGWNTTDTTGVVLCTFLIAVYLVMIWVDASRSAGQR